MNESQRRVFSTFVGVLCWLFASPCFGQWQISYTFDQQQAETALGAERVPAMSKALDRTKMRLESILSGSTGSASIKVEFQTLQPATALAGTSSTFKSATITVAKDKLKNRAVADNEPQNEVDTYDAIPTPTVPFFWDATAGSAGFISIPQALNNHLQLALSDPGFDSTITVRPPTSTDKWQYYPGSLKAGHHSFELVMFHESLHALGFASAADNLLSPIGLRTWDLFRFDETQVPTTLQHFTTRSRELRPGVDAAWVTIPFNASHTYKASRGTRQGGDGFQASHWRSRTLLNPQDPIGVMDPDEQYNTYTAMKLKFYLRSDIEALDVMGWNVDPNTVKYATTTPVNLIAPADGAVVTTQTPTFSWEPNADIDAWNLFIYQGSDTSEDTPFRVYEHIIGDSFEIPPNESLDAGGYSWYVVGESQPGYDASETRVFVVSVCRPDFDMNGVLSVDDLFIYINAWTAGCLVANPPQCINSADYDQNGLLTIDDLFIYINAWLAGCP